MRRVLITGFGPFGGVASNPTDAGVRLAAQRLTASGVDVVDEVLPVSFERAGRRVRELVEQGRPDIAVAFGVATGRDAVTPERVAINVMDARIADVDGCQPVDQAIEPGGEVGRFGRLPLKTLVAALTAAGFAAKRSNSAGDYVCNRVFWDLMGALQPDAVGGFVHVPEGIDTASAIEVVARTLLAPAS